VRDLAFAGRPQKPIVTWLAARLGMTGAVTILRQVVSV
jgi:hypothetical protein